ncbi:DUF2752 domain-containing protein [Peptoniphilus sp. MSJ-1]|uniref:DUF2752 domain-containing protein n=1 Tax=Peptoniphilus ovalis TaxID=2841503 RepID=A0ABS6FGX0_9FIRM|nr:DUF2752 domain-containing protein [Peptoniphilus ovalis]MBU5668713.1 DUF2752 domain-containing protein [Peptoniphilus ovalis]
MKRKTKDFIIFILAVVFFYGTLHLLGYTCPIKALTGISCPGCGMTRAWIYLLKLDFKTAFYYHPLFIIPLIVLIGYVFQNKLPKKFTKIVFYIFIILFFVVYIYRMFTPNEIVVFRPKDSIFYKIITKLIN